MMHEKSGEAEYPAVKGGDCAQRGADALTLIAAVAIWSFAIAIGVATLWLFSDVLLLLFAAILIACQLRGAAGKIAQQFRVPYNWALVVVVVLVGSAIALVSYWRGPAVIGELQKVYSQINQQVAYLWQHFSQAAWLQSIVDRVRDYLGNRSNALAGSAAGLVTTSIGSLGSALLIVVAAIYLAVSPELYERGTMRLLPKAWRPRAEAVMREEGKTLRRWFVGQLVDMVAIGLMTGAGLWLLGVPLFPTLGLLAAICNFVPYVGALAGSAPAIIVALGQSPQTALWVALLFFIVQTIEGNLIAPLISRRTVDLPPVITLFSQTVLGTLFGPLGLILATPITAAAVVLVRMVYVEAFLEDDG